ncbi:concanavalin A-like lectin/glucanase domain-containing protein [Dipodascopsis uninucleata]
MTRQFRSWLYKTALATIVLVDIFQVVCAAPDRLLSLGSPVSKDKNTIPEWEKTGSVVVENDRVFLTTPGDKGQSGGIWTKNANSYETWTTEITFRVSGSDIPSGGMAIWYTAERATTGSVFGSSDNWDGLAIIIDSSGGQGSVRGHLNDGSITYSTLPEPQEQSFDKCALRYRNTGSLISLKLSVGPRLLKVEVDGRPCFEHHNIYLPPKQYLGISASSYENPDSFEIFTVRTEGSGIGKEKPTSSVKTAENLANKMRERSNKGQTKDRPIKNEGQALDGVDKEYLNILEKRILELRTLVESEFEKILDARDANGFQQVRPLIEKLDQRLGRIEVQVSRTEAQFHGATANMHESTKQNIASEISRLSNKLDVFDKTMKDHTNSLVGTLPETITNAMKSVPSFWSLLFVFLLLQSCVIGGYIFYSKRKRHEHPKYL